MTSVYAVDYGCFVCAYSGLQEDKRLQQDWTSTKPMAHTIDMLDEKGLEL